MTWKPQRRQRYEGFTLEQIARALADDMDLLDNALDEHIEEDMEAHRLSAETFQEWKLTSLRSQNRMLFAVVMSLLAAVLSILATVALR